MLYTPPNMRRSMLQEIVMLALGILMTVAGLAAFLISGTWQTLAGFIFFGVCTASSYFTLRKFRLARQRQAWQAAGLCPQCGYDLRATPTHCPECGYQKPQPPPPVTWTGTAQEYWSK